MSAVAPIKRRGRTPRYFGPSYEGCTSCARKPVYRNGELQPCTCGGAGNPRWPKTI